MTRSASSGPATSLTVRASVAAAGLAALGTGLAAPAFAVPTLPSVPSPTAAGAPAVAHAVTTASDAPSGLDDLPDPFTFQMPTVNAIPPAPTVDPEVRSTSYSYGTESAMQQLDGMSLTGASFAPASAS